MGRLKLKIKWQRTKTAKHVIFLDDININRTVLARVLTHRLRLAGVLPETKSITRPNVSGWMISGQVPDKYIPHIQKIHLKEVLSYRKPYQRKAKPVFRPAKAVGK